MRRILSAAAVVGGLCAAYVLTVRGDLTLDTGIGRRTRALGPIQDRINARPETVFDVISGPYLGSTPRAMQSKLRVVERGSDLVVAEHFTPVSRGLSATTVESVHFERPTRVSFRLLRGPVPHVTETFELAQADSGTAFLYAGTLGTDFWGLGAWWGGKVAPRWEATVQRSITSIKAEAERRDASPRH
ncbi:MAG: SRPBCC family protein [Candidatus Dormibacteria bacterium]